MRGTPCPVCRRPNATGKRGFATDRGLTRLCDADHEKAVGRDDTHEQPGTQSPMAPSARPPSGWKTRGSGPVGAHLTLPYLVTAAAAHGMSTTIMRMPTLITGVTLLRLGRNASP
jgi:hypothetical protein